MKKTIAVLLALVLVLSLIPMAASASMIPDGAPFTAITTDAGDILAIEQQDDVNGAPYYIVTIPEGAETVYLTAPAQVVMKDWNTGTMQATAYAFDVEDDWAQLYVSYNYEDSDDGPVVEIPMNMVATSWSGEMELCFVEDEDGYLTHAFGIEDENYTCLGILSFRYGSASEPEHTCTYDQKNTAEKYLKTAADCASPAVYYMSCTCGEAGTETFTHGEAGSHNIVDNKCTVCGALNATRLTWWYGNNATTEITIKAGDVVDAVAGCTPKASGMIGFSSADAEIVTVSADEAETDGNGHATVQLTGKKGGTTTVTAYSKIDVSKKAELTVNVTCGHQNTETNTVYTQIPGSEQHAAAVVCACGETVSSTTGSCLDENTDGECDLCGGDVELPEQTGPVCIFDSSIHGAWGSPITFNKLFIDGVSVKSYEWIGNTCIVYLKANTAPYADIDFSVEGLSGGGGAACLYINASKTDYTVNLVDGKADVEVNAASKFSSSSMSTKKTVSFVIAGGEIVNVESITITPENPVVKAGGSLQLTANVYPENATVKAVTWTTNAPNTAITLNAEGRVTGESMGMGQYYTVTATSQADPSISATAKVYLDYSDETSITISESALSLSAGDTVTLSATVEGNQFTANKTVTWSSSDESIATVDNGKVRALKGGTATITATSYHGLTATCVVTVSGECDHTYEETVTKQPGCAEMGEKTVTCSKCGTSYTDDVPALGHRYSDGFCSVCGEEDPAKPVTAYFSFSHDAEYVYGEATQEYMVLREFTVPYFDLALYGMEKYYFSSEFYAPDPDYNGTGSPSSALEPGTAETAYGNVTLLHAYIYLTEVYYCGLDPEEAGKGYLFDEGLVGTSTFKFEGSVGSIYMTGNWGYDSNLNYYVNYKYPLASEDWGSTMDQILLREGDIITIGHFTSGAFWADPAAVFNFIKVGDEVALETTAVQGDEIPMTVIRAGARMGADDYDTYYDPIASQPEVFYVNYDEITSGDVTAWTCAGEVDENGNFVLDTSAMEPGRYMVAIPGQYGVDNTTEIVSAPGGIIVNIEARDVVYGDADGDGDVDADDAKLILQYAAKKTVSIDGLAADVNGDGKIRPNDAALVLQFFKGKINSFPVGKNN